MTRDDRTPDPDLGFDWFTDPTNGTPTPRRFPEACMVQINTALGLLLWELKVDHPFFPTPRTDLRPMLGIADRRVLLAVHKGKGSR